MPEHGAPDETSIVRYFRVKNQVAEEIPAYGVMRITGVAADGTVEVNKPNADSQALICFNGPTTIPANGQGRATTDGPTRVLYATGDGTPAAANPPQVWGAANGVWTLRKAEVSGVPTYAGMLAWGGVSGSTAIFGRGYVAKVQCVGSNIEGTWTGA
jgi:hypothetical protein